MFSLHVLGGGQLLGMADARAGRLAARHAPEHEAEDDGRDAEKAGADEEEGVALEQGSSARQPLDDHAGKTFGELADVRV